MKIIVVGGGLGGLALASGLRRAGHAVEVVERDRDLASTGGYHITLQRPVQQALEALLPAEVYERLLASAADGRLRDPDVLWDRRGREVGRARLKSDDPGIDVDRITLRLLLAEAAGDSLRIGVECTGFDRDGSGVSVRLSDGSTLDGDLLVGADGVHSLIARQLAGGPTNAPTGLVGVSGRTAIADLRDHDRRRLGTRSSLGIGPGATALYLGFLDPAGHAVLDAPGLRASVTTEPTFIWGAMFRESAKTRAMAKLGGPALRDATVEALARRGWAPAMTDVISRTDPATVGLFRFHAAPEAARDQARWPAGRVTALGDAVHATPPTAGMGAGAAIRDAHRLVEGIGAVESGEKPLSIAIRDFEADMRERGSEVIRAAMGTVRQILATDTPVGGALIRAGLPVMGTAASVRRRLHREG